MNQEQAQKLIDTVMQLSKEIETLSFKVKQLEDTRFKTAKREIINHEIQFMQQCFNKNGVRITQIN